MTESSPRVVRGSKQYHIVDRPIQTGMLGLGEVRCGAERVTCAFTTTDLQSHGFDLNESSPHVWSEPPDNGWFTLRCGLWTWPDPAIFAGLGVIVGP